MSFDPISFAMGAKSGGGGGSTGGGVLVVNMDADTSTLDKTWQEIADADIAVIKSTGGNGISMNCPVIAWAGGNSRYGIWVGYPDLSSSPLEYSLQSFVCTSADEYPVLYQGG